MAGVRVRNTTVNGGMTGVDEGINKVFSHKQGTGYSTMKKRVAASNPNTAAQSAVRSVFAQTSAGWSALTEAQRQLWNAEAPNWVGTNVFGDTQPSGKNLYTGCNVALMSAGLAQISEPKAKALSCVPNETNLTLAGGVLSFIADFADFSDVNAIQLRVSKQQTAGTSICKKLTVLRSDLADGNINGNVTAAYVAKYGALVPGMKIFYETRTISEGGNSNKHMDGIIVIP